jgi:hypothetical protein
MKMNRVIGIAACVALASSVDAQNLTRRADIRGGGSFDSGKCTVEVVVDGAAEIEIRGDTATLRNLKGQMTQWRRFECTSPLPGNPANFQFRGVDGRGRQELVSDPRRGGVAVIRITDPDNGTEGYTFDIRWGAGGEQAPPPGRVIERGPSRRFTTEEAVRVCQDSVREQAYNRFRARDVEFLRTNLDDQPGRNDWVVGMLAVRRYERREVYRFSCSVNFDSGRVRSAEIQAVAEREERPMGGGGTDRALANCRRGVEERLHSEGFDRIEFRSIRVDDQPGRNDWVVGNVRAESRGRAEFRDFSCSVNMRDGDVRSIDVRRPR